MKILIYNIAYGTGSPGGEYRRIFTTHRYLTAPERPFRKIVKFIRALDPDVIGLVEADFGSRRTRGRDHVGELAEEAGYYHHARLKYGPRSVLQHLPYLKHQGNALLSREPDAPNHAYFFPRGMKKLILRSRIGGIDFYLLHLALTRQVRKIQLEYLAGLIRPGHPTVVAGDFNTFRGEQELEAFLAATGMRNADPAAQATYPAWRPAKELDYILVSPELEVPYFDIPHVRFSDHLPLVAELKITPSQTPILPGVPQP